jgi:peroxiredoxin
MEEKGMKNPSLVCQSKSKVFASLMCILGVVLLFVNVLLVQQNKKLKVLAGKPDRALEVSPGTELPPLEGLDSNGNRHSVNYGQDSRKTVLLVLSPRCNACEENMPNWKEIINRLDRQSFRAVAISLQSEVSKEYAIQRGIDQIPVLTNVDPKYRVAYNLALTPQMILIGADGKVEKVWTGVLREEEKQTVELALSVRLP